MKLWLVAVFMLIGASGVIAQPAFQLSGVSADWDVVYPKQEAYKFGDNISLSFHVYDQNGTIVQGNNATCIYDLYDEKGVNIVSQTMTPDGNHYVANISSTTLNKTGTWEFLGTCQGVLSGGYVSGTFQVTSTGLAWADAQDLTPIAVIILLPFLLALICIIGAVSLDPEDHAALKIGLFLFSFLPFYVSLWWGAVALGRWYNFPQLSDAIGSGTFFGVMFFILLIAYTVFYFIWKAFEAIAEKKAKRLSY